MVKLSETLVFDRTKCSIDTVTRLNLWYTVFLNCRGCDVDDIELCSQMPNLVVLALSVNNVKTLEPLMYCYQLEELYVRKNNIEDLNQIEFLRPLKKLRTLWLDENPCVSEENYRLRVVSALPQLKMLDNRPVTKEELEQAANLREPSVDGSMQSTPEVPRSARRRSSHHSDIPEEAKLAVEPHMFQSCYGAIPSAGAIPQTSPYGSLPRRHHHQDTPRGQDMMSMSMYAQPTHQQNANVQALQNVITAANEQLMAIQNHRQIPSMQNLAVVSEDMDWPVDFAFDDPPSVPRDDCQSPVMPLTAPSTYITQQQLHSRKRYNRSRSISPSKTSGNILVAISNLLDELDYNGLRAVIDEAQRRIKKVR